MTKTQVTVALGADFLASFSRLPKAQQGKVRKFVSDFRQNPASHSIHLEKVKAAEDPNIRSVRIDQSYRGIMLGPESGQAYVFLWVDQHDAAYRWAEHKLFTIHPETGAIQLLHVEEGVQPPPSEEKPEGMFNMFRDRELRRVGVPEALIPLVRTMDTEEDLENCRNRLPQEAYEALFLLAAGDGLEEVERELFASSQSVVVDTGDFAGALDNAHSQRRFVVVSKDSDLQEMLDFPLDRWRVFLHPTQRDLVAGQTSGPFRVLGGAGTGKTVVAMHRAKHLAEHVCKADTERILFTTFNRNLALDIEANLKKICPRELLRKIEVINIDAWAQHHLKRYGFEVNIVPERASESYWQQALLAADPALDLSDRFYRTEWEKMVQQRGVETREEYLQASRIGSGTRLNRRSRSIVWNVFERYRELLTAGGFQEYGDVIRSARRVIEEKQEVLPYRAVVVDESQDMSHEAFSLIRVIAQREGGFRPDSLFVVGDAYQRIYGRRVVLSQCGIPIVGRSRKLKINYRTTEETRKLAVSVLTGRDYDDLDGGTDDQRGYVSLANGQEPLLCSCETFQEEIATIRSFVEELHEYEEPEEGICIVCRTRSKLENYRAGLEATGLHTVVLSGDGTPSEGGTRIATMHRVKGIEFDHIIVAGADGQTVPLEYLVSSAESEVERDELDRQERSLLYVALTRARKNAVITWHGTRSPYLSTVPKAAHH